MAADRPCEETWQRRGPKCQGQQGQYHGLGWAMGAKGRQLLWTGNGPQRGGVPSRALRCSSSVDCGGRQCSQRGCRDRCNRASGSWSRPAWQAQLSAQVQRSHRLLGVARALVGSRRGKGGPGCRRGCGTLHEGQTQPWGCEAGTCHGLPAPPPRAAHAHCPCCHLSKWALPRRALTLAQPLLCPSARTRCWSPGGPRAAPSCPQLSRRAAACSGTASWAGVGVVGTGRRGRGRQQPGHAIPGPPPCHLYPILEPWTQTVQSCPVPSVGWEPDTWCVLVSDTY